MRTFLSLLLLLGLAVQTSGDRRAILLSKKPAAAGGGSFTPGDYGTVLVWYKADALSLSDNDPVVTWTDSGPNSFHATNLTESGSRPVYKTGVVNSKPVVRFDGSDFLFWAATSGNAGTVFVVVGNVTHTGANSVIGADTANKRVVTFFPDATTIYAGDGGELFSNTFTTRVNGAATSAFPAGFGLITQTASSPVDMGAFFIGQSLNDDFVGDVAEILIYTTALGSTDRDAVESALMSKYGL